MNLGDAGEALIKGFEELRFVAYRRFPGEPWTCGWGHTGSDVTEGTTCTRDGAQAWFVRDTAAAVRANNEGIVVPVTQNQFDALVSFAFNVGIGAESHSTLLRLVNAGRFSEAAGEFIKWDHVDGQPSAGLLRRREAEQALFQAA